MTLDVAKGAALVFVAAILQVTLLTNLDVNHGAPDLVLVSENGSDLKGAVRTADLQGKGRLTGMHTQDDAFVFVRGAHPEGEADVQDVAATALDGLGLWDETDGMYYDRLKTPDGQVVPVKVRSMVGIIPALAAAVRQAADDVSGRLGWIAR